MKLVYADPPYIGQAERHYSDQPLHAEVDHAKLIKQLMTFDGWALSASSVSLWTLARLGEWDGDNWKWIMPDAARVGSWVKPWASFKPNVNPAYAWEPVIFWGGRNRGRDLPTLRDWISANATMKKGIHGAKPLKVCYWLFEMLGAVPGDDFTDLFPGTGIVGQAWENFNRRVKVHDLPMFAEATAHAGG